MLMPFAIVTTPCPFVLPLPAMPCYADARARECAQARVQACRGREKAAQAAGSVQCSVCVSV